MEKWKKCGLFQQFNVYLNFFIILKVRCGRSHFRRCLEFHGRLLSIFLFSAPKRDAVKLSRCFCPRDVITGPWPVHTPLTALQSTHDVKCPWCYKTNQIGGRKINVQPSSNSSKSSYEISGKKIQFSNSLFTLKIAKL